MERKKWVGYPYDWRQSLDRKEMQEGLKKRREEAFLSQERKYYKSQSTLENTPTQLACSI